MLVQAFFEPSSTTVINKVMIESDIPIIAMFQIYYTIFEVRLTLCFKIGLSVGEFSLATILLRH